jgi:hypothetical protein
MYECGTARETTLFARYCLVTPRQKKTDLCKLWFLFSINYFRTKKKALLYAAQLRRKGRRVIITLPSATTARDLQPACPGETRPRTSHRDIARNNSCKLQQLGAHVTINVDTAITPQRLQHAAGAAAHSGDLHMQVSVPGHAMHAIRFWDELRTWDPGD